MATTPPGGSAPPGGEDLDGIEATIRSWKELGARYGRSLGEAPGETPDGRARRLQLLLELGELREAQTFVANWLMEWLEQLPERGEPEQLAQVELWHCLADVVEHTNDQALLELFWQGIERIRPPLATPGVLPLLGVPLLKRVDLLRELLASLDVPVGTLALVDHSGGRQDQGSQLLRAELERLERQGHPGIGQVRVARPFGNEGVATAWNEILLSFPEAAERLGVSGSSLGRWLRQARAHRDGRQTKGERFSSQLERMRAAIGAAEPGIRRLKRNSRSCARERAAFPRTEPCPQQRRAPGARFSLEAAGSRP